jgi:hypothetical protein
MRRPFDTGCDEIPPREQGTCSLIPPQSTVDLGSKAGAYRPDIATAKKAAVRFLFSLTVGEWRRYMPLAIIVPGFS